MTSLRSVHAAALVAGLFAGSLAPVLTRAAPAFAIERDVGTDSPAYARGTKLPAADAPEAREEATQGGASATPDAPTMKVIPDNFSDAIGTWDLSREGSNNRCTLVLASDNTQNGRVVRFPAGCRRALPALAGIVGWLFADGGIRLVDKNVRPLLKFVASKDRSSLTARDDGGAIYALVPLQTMAMLPPSPAVTEQTALAPETAATPKPETAAAAMQSADASEMRSSLQEIPGSQPVLPSGQIIPRRATAAAAMEQATPGQTIAALTPAPGIYALDRFSEKDVCRLELASSRVAGKIGKDVLSAARILPGCHDSGIAVFDPVSWRFANGHMTLKAKRGHAVNLIAAGDGSWRRDPDVGTTFVLRKIEP